MRKEGIRDDRVTRKTVEATMASVTVAGEHWLERE